MTTRRHRNSNARTAAPQRFRAFEVFCRELVLDNGEPFVLEKAQARILRPHFTGRPEIVAIMPTGNGKSTLLAARGLHHMLTTPQAECIIAAAAADQAAIIFDQMAGLVERSEIPLDVKRGVRAIYHKGDGPNRKPLGRIRVISADAVVNAGAIPTLVLIDELWAHRDGHLYNMFQARLNKRGAQMLTISNAGWDEASFLATIRERAHQHESFRRRGMVNHARMGPLEFFEWCLDADDDPLDIPTVKKANPIDHVTLEDLETRLASPGLIWEEWLRNTCGLWTTVNGRPFVDPDVWDGLKVDIGGLSDGEPVWIACRVFGGGCGIGIAGMRADGSVAVRGESLPYDWPGLQLALRRLTDRYDVQAIFVDRRQFGIGGDVFVDGGLPLEDLPHTVTRFVEATATFLGLVSSGQLLHDGDPELREQVKAGRMKETTTGGHLNVTDETRTLGAVLLATHEAAKYQPEPLIVLPSGTVG